MFEMFVNNVQNVQYYGTLYVGSHRQKMTFILDTGSSWMWLPNLDCKRNECVGQRYFQSESETYTTDNELIDVKYGEGYVEGLIA